MSNSNQLRQTITDNKIANSIALKVEKNVIIACKIAINQIQTKYSKYQFSWEKDLKKSQIHSHFTSLFCDSEIGSNLNSQNSKIKPDGGLYFLISPNGSKFLLGAVEAKKQGTNNIRITENKTKQAQGNAIERACKNYLEFVNLLLLEEIYPYLIFMNGCDLEETNSTIRDRVTAMNLGSPFNKLYIYKIKDKNNNFHARASLFIGVNDIELMSKIIFQLYETSFLYYLNKYPEHFNAPN